MRVNYPVAPPIRGCQAPGELPRFQIQPMRQFIVTTLIGFSLLLALGTSEAADLPVWETDIDVALERSKQEGKDLLLAFRGPSVNKECKRINEEVLDGIEFRTVLGSQFILFTVVDPRDAELDEEGMAAYRDLLKRFHIDVYPITLLADSEGRVYGQTSAQRPEAKFFVQAISELGPNREILGEALRLAAKPDAGTPEVKQLSDTLERLGIDFVLQHHIDLVEKVIGWDQDGALGLSSLWEQRRYNAKVLRTYNQIYVSIAQHLTEKKTPQEKIQLIDETIAKHSMEGELLQLMEMRKFWVWNDARDQQKMLQTLRKVQALAPDSALAGRVSGMIQALEKRSAAPTKPKAETDEGVEEKKELPAKPAGSNGEDPVPDPEGSAPRQLEGATEPQDVEKVSVDPAG